MSDLEEDYGDPMDLDAAITFHRFQELPKELRDMIWAYVVANIPPRTVEIWGNMPRCRQHPVFRSRLNCDIDYLVLGHSPIPAVFRVNSESKERATALVPKEFHTLIKGGPIYFDYTKDTLLFSTNTVLAYFVGHATNILEEREPQTESQIAELKRFSDNIHHIAVRSTIDSTLPDMVPHFWKAKEISFLKEEYRFQPWKGRLNCELNVVPSPLPSQVLLDFHVRRIVLDCLRATKEAARQEGLLWEIMGFIDWKDRNDLEPAIAEEIDNPYAK
jgi:hypothetical protein